MTPARLRWGLIFVAVGVALLLTNADVLDYEYWMELLALWPLILIAIGLEKIFLHSKLRFISYLAPLILVGGMVYAGFVSGTGSYHDGFLSSYRWTEDIDDSVKSIEAEIDHRRNDIDIGRSYSDQMSARFDRLARRPYIDYSVSDGVAKLDIDYRSGGFGRVIVINSRRLRKDWQLSFTDKAPLKLKCLGEESDVNLNFESVPVEQLAIDNNEGDIYLKIGELIPDVNIEIIGEDAVFRLKAPDSCGLKVKVSGSNYDGYLKSINLVENGDYFVSDNFDSSAVRVNLDIDDNLRSFSIDYY